MIQISLTAWRRISQVAFILFVFLMPVLNILRIDSDTHELILFGTSWSFGIQPEYFMDRTPLGALHIAGQFFLKGILPWVLFLAIFPLLGWLTGRLFCGWLCPEGALFELSDFLTLKLIGRRSLFGKRPSDPVNAKGSLLLYGAIAVLSAVVIPLAGGIALTGYFVAPKTVWLQVMTGEFTFGVTAGIIGVAIYMLITSIVVRHVLCRYVCAAGLMQMLFGWISPVELVGLAEETDAAVIVVSEQTGAISVAHRGALRERLDEGALRAELVRIFRIRPQDEPEEIATPVTGEKAADAG